MKLYCLGAHPNKPCYVLRFKEINLMLDCSLYAQTVLNFLPLSLVPSPRLKNLANWIPKNATETQLEGELKECNGRVFVNSSPEFCPPLHNLVDFSEVDAILITNYTTLLALPFITEATGFKGTVYMTEATLFIGRFYLEELVDNIEQTPRLTLAKHWKDVLHMLPPPLSDCLKPKSWQQVYNLKSVRSCLSRVRTVGYDEKLSIYGMLKVSPISSGYCLGSCNWIIKSDYEKIVYLNSSSTLTTHPSPMEQGPLKNADILLLSSLTQTPTSNPDTMLGDLCMAAASTVRNNGCVLFPCFSSGIVYDLFECLSSHFDNAALIHIPMYFISPVADVSLGYSNILAEWLSHGKQTKVFLPEEPFPHAHLVKNGRLRHFKQVYDEAFCNDLRQPCVVFCGHPSLRFGAVVHFMELWGSSSSNTIIFTEPEFPYLEALAPYQPLAMKTIQCPIDTSLNFTQANKLIRELKPTTLVLPDSYLQPPISHPHRSDLLIEPQVDRRVISVSRGEVATLPLKRSRVLAKMTADVASNIAPTQVALGTSLSAFTAVLQVKDNNYIIQEAKKEEASAGPSEKKQCLTPFNLHKSDRYGYSTLNIDQFITRLNMEGIKNPKIERGIQGHIIHLQDEDTLIQIDNKSTHIYCEASDTTFRIKLKNILLECLNTF